MEYCKEKRQKAFSAMIFSEKWVLRNGFKNLQFCVSEAKELMEFADQVS